MKFKIVNDHGTPRAEAYIHKSNGEVDFISIKITDGYVTQHNIECVLEAYRISQLHYDKDGNEVVHDWEVVDMTPDLNR